MRRLQHLGHRAADEDLAAHGLRALRPKRLSRAVTNRSAISAVSRAVAWSRSIRTDGTSPPPQSSTLWATNPTSADLVGEDVVDAAHQLGNRAAGHAVAPQARNPRRGYVAGLEQLLGGATDEDLPLQRLPTCELEVTEVLVVRR